ncbi:hypothetical protein GJAV_G00244270 [Gymnothorax javanicus]|nr:hypothetical protein GJAV_G00244270 [Gymnothorax javanicus]
MTRCTRVFVPAILLLHVVPCVAGLNPESPSLISNLTLETASACASLCNVSLNCNFPIFDEEKTKCYLLKCPDVTVCQNLSVDELIEKQVGPGPESLPSSPNESSPDAQGLQSGLLLSTPRNGRSADVMHEEGEKNSTLVSLSTPLNSSKAPAGVGFPAPALPKSEASAAKLTAAPTEPSANSTNTGSPVRPTNKSADAALAPTNPISPNKTAPTNPTATNATKLTAPPAPTTTTSTTATSPSTSTTIITTKSSTAVSTAPAATTSAKAMVPEGPQSTGSVSKMQPTTTSKLPSSTPSISKTPPTTNSTQPTVKEEPSGATTSASAESAPTPVTSAPRTTAGKEGRNANKAILDVAAGPLTRQLVDTSSLLAVLLFGVVFFLVTVVLFLSQAYDSYKKRDYTQVDYLINGMYSDSASEIIKMQKCFGIVCVTIIFSAALTETVGLVTGVKEKRGWTLNSAGYLLGPHAIDSHRTLSDKHGLAGKRDLILEDDFKSAASRVADENVIHTIIDFLSYLKMKEMGTLDSQPSSFTSEEMP